MHLSLTVSTRSHHIDKQVFLMGTGTTLMKARKILSNQERKLYLFFLYFGCRQKV